MQELRHLPARDPEAGGIFLSIFGGGETKTVRKAHAGLRRRLRRPTAAAVDLMTHTLGYAPRRPLKTQSPPPEVRGSLPAPADRRARERWAFPPVLDRLARDVTRRVSRAPDRVMLGCHGVSATVVEFPERRGKLTTSSIGDGCDPAERAQARGAELPRALGSVLTGTPRDGGGVLGIVEREGCS